MSSKPYIHEVVQANIGKNIKHVKIEDQQNAYGHLLDPVKDSQEINYKISTINSCSRSAMSPQNEVYKDETFRVKADDDNSSVDFNIEDTRVP